MGLELLRDDCPLDDALTRGLISGMCDAFLDRFGACDPAAHPETGQSSHELMSDFISDLTDLTDLCSPSARIDCGAELERKLIPALLHDGGFESLKGLVEARRSWFDMASLRQVVSNFVRGSVSATAGGGQDNAAAVVACQETLGPLFPDLREEFVAARRFLDIKRFVREVLHCGHGDGPVSRALDNPARFGSTPTLCFIDDVLRENLRAIVMNFPGWADPMVAARANQDICRYFARLDSPLPPDGSEVMQDSDAKDLPPPPGELILQLADMVGLGDPRGRIRVRGRMVLRAAESGLHGAAAALCTLLLRDTAALPEKGEGSIESCDEDAEIHGISLRSAAAVISSDSYGDFRMRRALCLPALLVRHKIDASCTWDAGDALATILRYVPVLDAKTAEATVGEARVFPKAFQALRSEDHTSGDRPTRDGEDTVDRAGSEEEKAGEFLVFRAAGLVAKGAKSVVGRPTENVSARASGETNGHGAALDVDGGDTEWAFRQIMESSSIDVRDILETIRINLISEIEGGGTVSTETTYFKTNQSMLKVLSRQILLWCAAESVKTVSNPQADARTAGRISQMLQLGVSLLLEIRAGETAISILDDVQCTLETDSASVMEDMAMEASPCSRRADEGIVRQLCGRGYTENGARRSAAMTGNESFRLAFMWAVKHFQDPGFDLPVVFVKPEGKSNVGADSLPGGFLDQRLLSMIRDTLIKTRAILDKGSAVTIPTLRKQPQSYREKKVSVPAGGKKNAFRAKTHVLEKEEHKNQHHSGHGITRKQRNRNEQLEHEHGIEQVISSTPSQPNIIEKSRTQHPREQEEVESRSKALPSHSQRKIVLLGETGKKLTGATQPNQAGLVFGTKTTPSQLDRDDSDKVKIAQRHSEKGETSKQPSSIQRLLSVEVKTKQGNHNSSNVSHPSEGTSKSKAEDKVDISMTIQSSFSCSAPGQKIVGAVVANETKVSSVQELPPSPTLPQPEKAETKKPPPPTLPPRANTGNLRHIHNSINPRQNGSASITNGADSPHIALLTTPKSATPNASSPSSRDSLRERGRITRMDVHSELGQLGADERRRLAIEGRRLLKSRRLSPALKGSPQSSSSKSKRAPVHITDVSRSPEDRHRLAMEGRRLIERLRKSKKKNVPAVNPFPPSQKSCQTDQVSTGDNGEGATKHHARDRNQAIPEKSIQSTFNSDAVTCFPPKVAPAHDGTAIKIPKEMKFVPNKIEPEESFSFMNNTSTSVLHGMTNDESISSYSHQVHGLGDSSSGKKNNPQEIDKIASDSAKIQSSSLPPSYLTSQSTYTDTLPKPDGWGFDDINTSLDGEEEPDDLNDGKAKHQLVKKLEEIPKTGISASVCNGQTKCKTEKASQKSDNRRDLNKPDSNASQLEVSMSDRADRWSNSDLESLLKSEDQDCLEESDPNAVATDGWDFDDF